MQLRKGIKSFEIALFTVSIYLIYSHLFGRENASIGMLIGMTAYSLLKVDLTLYLRYKLTSLSVLVIYLGVMAYVASINPWLGLIINSITFFTVCFIYVADFQSSISYLFLLIYIFMWASPIAKERLGVRILALLLGVGIIFLLQKRVNKDQFHQQFRDKMIVCITYLEDEIHMILENRYVVKDYMEIKLKLYEVFGGMIKRKRVMYATQEKIYFQVWLGIERLTQTIHQMQALEKKSYKEYLQDLLIVFEMIKKWFGEVVDTEELLGSLRQINQKYEKEAHNDQLIEACYEVTKGLVLAVENKVNIQKDREKLSVFFYKMKEAIELTFDPNILSRESLRISYAIRVALTVSLCMWVVSYWNIPYGRWIVVTSYVVIQPNIEDTRAKSKQRIYGTILGTLGYIVLNIVIPYEIPRPLLMLILFTGYFYVSDYDKRVIFMSMIALSGVMGSEKLLVLSMNRILFGIIGITVVAVVNQYIFPYSIKDVLPELMGKYRYLIDLFEEGILESGTNKENRNEVIQRGLYIMALENQLMQYALKTKDETLLKEIYESSIKFSNLGFSMIRYNN